MESDERKCEVDEKALEEEIKKMHIFGEIYYITIRTENKNHYAKRNVLAQRSTYFHTMFTSSFYESDKDVIDLPSIASENLDRIIEFTDTDRISLTADNALTLLQDADYLGIDDLKQRCFKFICEHVTTRNAFQAYRTADLLDHELLKEKAKIVICGTFLLVAERDKHFVDCDVEFLTELLSTLRVKACPGVAVFNAVMRWFSFDMEWRRKHLEKVLARIQLEQIDQKYLKNYLKAENISEKLIEGRMLRENVNTHIIVLQRSSLSIAEIYSCQTGKWEVVETGEQECRESYTCAAYDGKLYVFGGKINGKCTNTAKVYDISNNSWSSIAPMSTARQRAAAAVLDNYIYVFGGRKDEKTDLNSVERYCPTTNEWQGVAPFNESRCDHCAVAFEGELYVSGGKFWSRSFDNFCNWSTQFEKYDPRTDTWTKLEIIKPHRRSNFGIAALNDKIYLCGGVNYGRHLKCADYYSVNGDNRWKFNHNLDFCMNQWRSNYALVACEGKLWAIGGSDGTVEIYDPKTTFWTYGPCLNQINGAVVGAVFQL